MDLFIKSMNTQIKKIFKTYKHKLIATQIFDLILEQLDIIKINCSICLNPVSIQHNNDHLLQHCKNATNIFSEQHLLILGQCYQNGTYISKDNTEALNYYNEVLSINTNNSIAIANINLISIYNILFKQMRL